MQRFENSIITLKDLRSALEQFKGKRTLLSMPTPAEAGLELLHARAQQKIGGKDGFLDNALLLDLTILCARTNPKLDFAGSSILCDLLKNMDMRIGAAVRAVLDVGGINDGTCLADCFELMQKHPKYALEIAMVKSMLYVAISLAGKTQHSLPKLKEFYLQVNSDLKLVRAIRSAIPTLNDFGIMVKAPDKSQEYVLAKMQKNVNGFTLFKQKAVELLEGQPRTASLGKTG